MRKPFIAGNWKMHKTINQAIELTVGIKRELSNFQKADIAVFPPFTALDNVSDTLRETDIKLGAQNMFWEETGAFTGEVSCAMLKDCGCEYVIIGHSERRKYFFETDTTVNKRIKAALLGGITPIFCLGETLEEREADKTLSVINTQLVGGLEGISQAQIANIVIAYEPVWAIGTGKTATPQQAQEVHAFIRDWVKNTYSLTISSGILILYGGSVKPANISELMKEEDIDGALVGGASLDVASFVEIVKNSCLNYV
jgi:triosephosphate isomerase